MAERFPVCTIDGIVHSGSINEVRAARLKPGDRVIFLGTEDTVRRVWFYDGVIVDLVSGRAIFAALGDVFVSFPSNGV